MPRKGHHLKCPRCVVAYSKKMSEENVCIRTHKLDSSAILLDEYDWGASIIDEVLCHDWARGCSVTGILHSIDWTPINWFSMDLLTVETAVYELGFVTARTCIKQVMNFCKMLQYLGVPICGTVSWKTLTHLIYYAGTRVTSKSVWQLLEPQLFWKGAPWTLKSMVMVL